MAMDPLHRLRSLERQRPRQHLVEDHSERIKVGPRVHRAIHAASLLGCHVSRRSREHCWQIGRLALACQSRGNAEPGEPSGAARPIYKEIVWLEVAVYQALGVEPA